MKILIVEDEKLLADSLKTALEKKGFAVETAYDGETGKQYAELGSGFFRCGGLGGGSFFGLCRLGGGGLLGKQQARRFSAPLPLVRHGAD